MIRTKQLFKIKSPSGKIHFAYLTHKDKGVEIYDPLCNHRTFAGDYWGKKWAPTSWYDEVNCKNCLSANGELGHKVKVVRRIRAMERNVTGRFKTKAEADAYVKGLDDGHGWPYIEVNGKN